MKQCIGCKQLKSPTEFSKRKSSHDGLQPKCKACNKKDNAVFREKRPTYKKEWDIKNPGAQAQIVYRYWSRNPEKQMRYIHAYYNSMGMGVYKITCDITQDFYIGYSSQLRARFNVYKRGTETAHKLVNRNLWDALVKYGVENFTFEILEQVEDKSMLREREKFWIKKLDPTYNIDK